MFTKKQLFELFSVSVFEYLFNSTVHLFFFSLEPRFSARVYLRSIGIDVPEPAMSNSLTKVAALHASSAKAKGYLTQ